MTTYPITQDFIPGLPENPYRNGVGAFEGVVNHSTANTAPAINERNYEASGAWQNAFVQFFVDWTSIIQSASTDYECWGAGPTANARYVQIELCETSDAAQFTESYNRYVWLTAKILLERKLGVKDGVTLLSHQAVSNMWHETTHTDPISYLESHGISWAQHVANVQEEYSRQLAPEGVSQPIGVVTVICDYLHLRTGAGLDFPLVENHPLLYKGEQYKVWGEKEGWYNLGSGWCSGEAAYVSFKPL